ncbi:MAG: CDGSH-type Zn-finger protein [Parasphingorhabdus sp.]|jgi:CDGSH-type Zn-finger protein
MSKPIIAKRGPYRVDLSPGTYWWCQCGKSANQPFCDGSHKGGEFQPKKLEITEAGTFPLCGCKQSAKGPMCDGTHRSIEDVS